MCSRRITNIAIHFGRTTCSLFKLYENTTPKYNIKYPYKPYKKNKYDTRDVNTLFARGHDTECRTENRFRSSVESKRRKTCEVSLSSFSDLPPTTVPNRTTTGHAGPYTSLVFLNYYEMFSRSRTRRRQLFTGVLRPRHRVNRENPIRRRRRSNPTDSAGKRSVEIGADRQQDRSALVENPEKPLAGDDPGPIPSPIKTPLVGTSAV